MKTRNGFVSNSSSSSFIIALEKEPTTPEDIKTQLFTGNHKKVRDPYGDNHMSADDASKSVFSRLGEKCSMFDILAEIENGGVVGTGTPEMKKLGIVEPEYSYNSYKLSKEQAEKIRMDYDEKMAEFSRKLLDYRFGNLSETTVFYILSYSDECGESVMEHGDLFAKIPYIKVSHH
jgi:hypothetical protein